MILLDTCTLLWLVGDQGRLSPHARERLRDGAGELFVSAISAFW